MSQRRRQRAPVPVEAPPATPPPADPPEPAVEAEAAEPADVAPPSQSHAVVYGLTIAIIVLLLVCAGAVYIAAP